MAAVTDEYKRVVLDDVESYEGLTQPVKTNFFARKIIKKMDVNRLHPNPQDEFSIPDIGPNYEIVANYESEFRRLMLHGQTPMEDALIVEKMSTGGYMLLNGHHRWLAAKRVGLVNVPVEIVNVTPEEEIISKIRKSNRVRCASFDLDEVLWTNDEVEFPLSLFYKKTLRKNADTLIKELRDMGFDIWVYTGEYHSTSAIENLFLYHHTVVDGIINGMKHKKSSAFLKDAFREQYALSLHIDNEGVICVDTKNKTYETKDIIPSENNWAAEVMTIIKQMEFVTNQ